MEAQANIGLEVAEKFVAYSDKGMTLSAVNFPEIALPLTEGKHRLLHIHKNIPGVLSKINNLFAEHGINISGQTLMTKGDVGYLVMDVDATASQEALDTLHNLEGTIRVRVLFLIQVFKSHSLRAVVLLLKGFYFKPYSADAALPLFEKSK